MSLSLAGIDDCSVCWHLQFLLFLFTPALLDDSIALESHGELKSVWVIFIQYSNSIDRKKIYIREGGQFCQVECS